MAVLQSATNHPDSQTVRRGLSADEADELQQLQNMADAQVERFDKRMLDDVQRLYSKAKRIIDGASD